MKSSMNAQSWTRRIARFLLASVAAVIALPASPVWGEVLLREDFEDGNLAARGWMDIAKWGVDKSLSIAGAPEVTAKTGQKCLKIRYALGDTGGWMHHAVKGVKEFYCRYYRLFPKGWEWPKNYGPHDTIMFAGMYDSPTYTDLSVYLDFWRSADTCLRVATGGQKWGCGGYGQVLRKHGGAANQMAANVVQADKVELGKWHCVEYYARLSDPGQENGALRLWVNGKLVIDSWDKAQAVSVIVGNLVAGKKYAIRVEHHRGTDQKRLEWRARLMWESPSTKQEPIPAAQLYLQ